MARKCGGGGKKYKELSRNAAEAAATQHVKAAAKDYPAASTTQDELMACYMWVGV